MRSITEEIKEAGSDQIQDILNAVLTRYRQLYPQWEISLVTLEKRGDRNNQLNRIITVLEQMKA